MQELEVLLKRHDKNITFDHLNNRIRCYPHIINICSSHIIASSTRISKQFLETLKSEADEGMVYSNIDGDDDNDDIGDDDDDSDEDNNGGRLFSGLTDIPDFTLDEGQLDMLDDDARDLYIGLKRDPIKRARRVVRILRSSDQRKQAFKDVIRVGNEGHLFTTKEGVIVVPDLEPLCDVKTRWDSVYRMIERLLALQPVSVHMYRPPFRSYC